MSNRNHENNLQNVFTVVDSLLNPASELTFSRLEQEDIHSILIDYLDKNKLTASTFGIIDRILVGTDFTGTISLSNENAQKLMTAANITDLPSWMIVES